MKRTYPTIDAYLADVPEMHRATLKHLREVILSAVPDAEQVFSYGLPAFRVEGKVVAGFASASNFCAYYPFSGSTTAEFASELGDFEQTQGSVHFTPGHPLSDDLVRRMVLSRVEARGQKK